MPPIYMVGVGAFFPKGGGGRGTVTPIYKPYWYVPPQREGFLPGWDTPDFKAQG